jgi:signal transduction histidine kinase
MFAAGILRSALVYQDSPLLGKISLLMAAWLLTFIVSSLLADRSARLPAVLIGLEISLGLALLLMTRADFFAFLFAITAMQTMQLYTPRVAAVLIGLSALITLLSLVQPMGLFQAIALTLIFAAVSAFLATYIGTTRRARVVRERQQILARELQEANQQLELYSQQAQHLATGRERQRLARELHDSVTQTIFSMTLATQSALLLLNRDSKQVESQLDRLDELAQGALAEMQVLISELAPEARSSGGFLTALRQHLADRKRLDDLSVSLEVEGSQLPGQVEESSLFRIAQEALNNVIKHAGVSQAVLRLHLTEPFWMEIEDRGSGFDPQQAGGSGRVGLAGMRERAAEIGWNFKVDSTPGSGTRVRVEKGPEGAGQA